MVINQLIKDALTCTKERPRFAYVSPYLVQTKQIAWDYLKHYARVIPNVKFNESELKVTFPNDATIQLLGADNPDRLRGIYLDGVALDEFAQIKPNLFTEIISPALTDRLGYVIFLGTPKGKNHFWDLYDKAQDDPEWLVVLHKASKTGYIQKEELERAERLLSNDEFLQEYECSFEAAIKGAYYADEVKAAQDEARVCKSVYNKDLPVYTAWDIGYRDDTAIIFYQLFGKEVRIIDAYSNSGMTLPEYIAVLKAKPYTYETHYFPWDARIKPMSSGKSTVEVAQENGLKVKVTPSLSVQDGIQQARMLFARCWFDQDKTKDLINSLSQYHREYDESRKAFRTTPFHDWTSHFADSFRYLAISVQEIQPKDDQENVIYQFIQHQPGKPKNPIGLKPADHKREERLAVDEFLQHN